MMTRAAAVVSRFSDLNGKPACHREGRNGPRA